MATAAVRARKTRDSEKDEVFVMEARLKLLKEQMEKERMKREDLVKRNGSGSVWLNGRAGAMRGVRDVRALVRTNARERAARPASATSAADTEERPSPTEHLEGSASIDRPWTPGAGNADWTPAQRAADGTACGPDAPAAPPVDGRSTSRPATAPCDPVEVAAMECQTEPMPSSRKWSSSSRPATGSKRAVAKTYLSKILDARRQQQQPQQQ
jgi:hypothetical protein